MREEWFRQYERDYNARMARMEQNREELRQWREAQKTRREAIKETLAGRHDEPVQFKNYDDATRGE
jgi:hypothetical protein